MRRACVSHGESLRGHADVTSKGARLQEDSNQDRAQHSWPKTVAIPLRKVFFWGRYVAGSAFVILLARSALFGNDLQQQQDTLDHKYSNSRHSLGVDAGRALHSINSTGGNVRELSSSSGTHASSAGYSSAASRCGGHHTATNTLNSTMAFLFFTFVVCTILHHCNMYVSFRWRLPISVIMFIGGGLIGMFFLYVTDDDSEEHRGNGFDTLIDGVQGAAAMDPHALLYIILPPLLYESASSMDWHVLRKLLPSSILLAVPGVMLNTFLTGCFVKLFVTIGSKAPKWEESWLLGSILSATDPVAVVAALAELGAPKKLAALVEGESLLNDGSAVVCAYVFLEWSSPDDPDKHCGNDDNLGWFFCVLGYFLQVALGGAALGVAAGLILYYWLKLVRNLQLPIVEIAVVFTAVYGTFYLAEALHTSGVLASVTLGIVMAAGGLHRMSHDGRHNHHVNLSQVAYFCNQVAFFVAGIVSSRFMYSDQAACDHSAASGQAWLELFGLYAVIHLTRGLVVLTFWPFLKRWGYGITWKEACIMVYGGLRGAVGLVMGLIVEHHRYIDTDVAQMVAFHTSGIVLLTLFINGSTIDKLYKRLDMYPHNQYRLTHLRKSLGKLETACQKKGIKVITKSWFFKDCSFNKILRCVPKFTHIRFNESDIPCVDNIAPVKATLQSLAREAALFKKEQKRIYSFGEQHWSFGAKWRESKGQEFEKKVTALINKTSNMVERKDFLKNVQNSGDKSLSYRPAETKAQAGFYLSSRSVAEIQGLGDSLGDSVEDAADDPSIEIEMQKTKDMEIIVGLCSRDEDLLHCCSSHDEQVLGKICENSIGFNCNTCDVQFNSPYGSGEIVAEAQQQPLSSAGVVTISFQRQPKGEWEVRFEVSEGDCLEPRLTISVPFGPFQPSGLYPVVEFRYADRSKMLTADFNVESSLSIPSSPMGNRMSKFPSDRLPGSGEKAEDKVCASLQVAIAEDDSRALGSDARPGARVQLSFEPQLATDAESINELFHVLFNIVMHEYLEMQDHGIIGGHALAWLTEAVGAGLDCANQEVNSMRMADFISEKDSTPLRRMEKNICKDPAMQQIFTQMGNVNKTIVGLFEPLIVEYLSLERIVATPSWWDRLLQYTQHFGMLGFLSTRRKVECLWAFIEAHEKVLHESVCMSRFPDLVHCINQMVEFAKSDLKLLQEMQPRRFFYSKHILALRVIMNKRLLKLKKFVAHGWMSTGDAGALLDELWNRIVQADQFFPMLSYHHVDAPTDGENRKSGKWGKAFSRNGSFDNAWSDFEVQAAPKKDSQHPSSNATADMVTPICISDPTAAEENSLAPLSRPPEDCILTGNGTSLGGITVRVMQPHGANFGLRTSATSDVESPTALNDMPAFLSDVPTQAESEGADQLEDAKHQRSLLGIRGSSELHPLGVMVEDEEEAV